MCTCRLHKYEGEGGCAPFERDKNEPNRKLESEIFEVNTYCRKYEDGKRPADLLRCEKQDCTQELSEMGCKYMSIEGYCYTRKTQLYCEKNPDLLQCLTRDQITNPKRPVCPKKQAPLDIHLNCDRYKLRGKARYLRRCEQQDCKQAQSKVGCRYINDDGFCYTAPGQRYCKEDEEAVGADDPRCRTLVKVPLHPVCQASRSYESKLPNPADVGLERGLRVKFYYIGNAMENMPNVRKLVPNFVAAAGELHFPDDEAFKDLDSNLPGDNWAVDIDGVIAVEESGQYTFFMNSDDGSVLWIDGRMIMDNGGVHGADQEKEASIDLDEGYHTIKVNLFKNSRSAVLNVKWKGSGTNNMKDYVNGFHFKNAVPELESKNPEPAPADVGLTEGFLMKVYYTNMPNPLDRVPPLDSMTPDITVRSAYVDFSADKKFSQADAATQRFKTASPDVPEEHFAIEWEGVVMVQGGEYKFYLGKH